MALAAAIALAGSGACAEHVPIAGARCAAEHPCPTGYVCVGGGCERLAGAPPSRCERDEDCVIGACLDLAGFCVQCAHASDCAIGTCLTGGGLYQCGCDAHEQCATRRCNLPTHACVPCFHDRQCRADQWCEVATGTCRDDKKIDGDAADGEGKDGADGADDGGGA